MCPFVSEWGWNWQRQPYVPILRADERPFRCHPVLAIHPSSNHVVVGPVRGRQPCPRKVQARPQFFFFSTAPLRDEHRHWLPSLHLQERPGTSQDAIHEGKYHVHSDHCRITLRVGNSEHNALLIPGDSHLWRLCSDAFLRECIAFKVYKEICTFHVYVANLLINTKTNCRLGRLGWSYVLTVGISEFSVIPRDFLRVTIKHQNAFYAFVDLSTFYLLAMAYNKMQTSKMFALSYTVFFISEYWRLMKRVCYSCNEMRCPDTTASPRYSCHVTSGLFRCLIIHLIITYRKVSKQRDLCLVLSNHWVVWRADRTHCCQCAYQISKQYNEWNEARSLETIRYVVTGRYIRYWNGPWIPLILIISQQTHYAILSSLLRRVFSGMMVL